MNQVTNFMGLFSLSRRSIMGVLLMMALLAFEMFNFDTTRYALNDLLGGVHFLGVSWASILAIAFCSIDFAGLARLFTPEHRQQENAAWYLMGAWLLGATMNAVMTWWAVSLTLLNHPFGNEVLSREQLLYSVPVFIAALVWLTRILFIGAFSVAGEYIFDSAIVGAGQPAQRRRQQTAVSRQARPKRAAETAEQPTQTQPQRQPRVRRQTTRPANNRSRSTVHRPSPRPRPAGMHARGRDE